MGSVGIVGSVGSVGNNLPPLPPLPLLPCSPPLPRLPVSPSPPPPPPPGRRESELASTVRTMQTDYAVEYEKACTAYSNGEYDTAASIINQLVLEEPEEPKFWLLQGHIYYVLTQYDVAAARYEWVLNITDDPTLVEEATQGLEYARAYAVPDEGGSVFEEASGIDSSHVPDESASSIFSEASTEEYAEYLEELQDGDLDLDYDTNGDDGAKSDPLAEATPYGVANPTPYGIRPSVAASASGGLMEPEMLDDFSGSTEEYPLPEEPLLIEDLLDTDSDGIYEQGLPAANIESEFDEFEAMDLDLDPISSDSAQKAEIGAAKNLKTDSDQFLEEFEQENPHPVPPSSERSRTAPPGNGDRYSDDEELQSIGLNNGHSLHEWLTSEEELAPEEEAMPFPQPSEEASPMPDFDQEPEDNLANPFATSSLETPGDENSALEAAALPEFDLGPFAIDEELLAAVEETEWSEPEESDLPDFLPGSEMPDLLGMPELEVLNETPRPPVMKTEANFAPSGRQSMGAMESEADDDFAQFDEGMDAPHPSHSDGFARSDSDWHSTASAAAMYLDSESDSPDEEETSDLDSAGALERFPPMSSRSMSDGEEATLLMGMQDLADATPNSSADQQKSPRADRGRVARRRNRNIEPDTGLSDEDADLKTFVSGGFGASADLGPTRMVPLHDDTDNASDFDEAFGSSSYGAASEASFNSDMRDADAPRRSGARSSRNGEVTGTSPKARSMDFSDLDAPPFAMGGDAYGASAKNPDFLDEDEFFDDVNIPNFDLSEDTTGSNTTSSGFGLSTAMPDFNGDAGATPYRGSSGKDNSGLIGTEEFVSIGTTGENVPFYGADAVNASAESQSETSPLAFLENAEMGKKWLWVSLIGGAASAVAVAIVSHATATVQIPQVKDALMAVSGAAAAVLTTAGLGTRTASQMRRATDDLQRQFEAMSQGNFSARATAISEDEFGTLAHKFNLMARNIASVTAEVTRRAEEHEQAKEDLQRQVIRLLDDVEGAARGDLTVAAEVTADVLGAVADSFNLTIQNLREIVLQVKLAARQVAKSATDSENFARALSSDALRQAEELAATLNSVQVMTDAIQRVAESAKEAEDVARSASEIALRGGEKVEQTVAGILEVRETVAETTRKVKRLAESSQEISKIVALISAIASRTNLLALNASIEAARAGEAGRGFAIVADEVRLLADRSAKALKDIEQIVMQIQSETNAVMQAMEEGQQQVIQGTKLAEEAKRALESIIQVTNRIDVLVRSITADTVEQNETARAVAQVMQAVELTAQETSQESQKVSISLQNLVGVARDLLTSVERFRVDAGERH